VLGFVNYGFALAPPERAKSLTTVFWSQISRIRPQSYVADNEYLSFVSANKTLFANLLNAVKGTLLRTVRCPDCFGSASKFVHIFRCSEPQDTRNPH
jgi:hypothetical protein